MLQISVESKDLARAIGVVSRVINRRNMLPILGDVLLTKKDGAFYVTGGTRLRQLPGTAGTRPLRRRV